MIALRCLKCEARLAVPDTYAGKRVRCDRCTSVVLVPGVPAALRETIEVKEPAPNTAGSPLQRPPAPDLAEPEPPQNLAAAWLDYLRASKLQVWVSTIITAAGTFWLLAEIYDFSITWQWVWTGFLAACGVAVMTFGGINKQTLVIGPYLMILSIFSVIRQANLIQWRHEIPSLVIAFGLLLFVVTLLGYAVPDLVDTGESRRP